MKTIPSYTKILALGASGTENALLGKITIQEKVDGSLFGFGVNDYHQITMRSKSVTFTLPENKEMIPLVVEKMFAKAGESVQRFSDVLKEKYQNTYFYAEYMQSTKHNTLKYENTPKNNLMLFDGLQDGRWMSRKELEEAATLFDIDIVPILWEGDLPTYLREKQIKGYSTPGDFLTRLTETTQSFLGGTILEGVVLKNYEQTILLGGHIFPLFTKYVRESFKELHTLDWKDRQPKDNLHDYINSFGTEARWQKSLIHGKEQGILNNSLKDIQPMIEMIQRDVEEEEKENAKNMLWKMFRKDILGASIRGFVDWYKKKLTENLHV